MCGILAIYDPKRRWSREAFLHALNTLESRGPDGDGVWQEADVLLGHRRLSIIDLEGGAQPMASADGRALVTFNGEIYNFPLLREDLMARGHVFQTQSDTEVILACWREWGADCVEHLEGMFAFAIWDRSTQTFFAARDRTGIKPLYIGQWDGAIVFSSTLAPFFELPGFDLAVDPEALRDVLVYDYVPAPRSMLRCVRKLRPGHSLLWQVADPFPASHAFWEVPHCDPQPVDFSELVDRCSRALDRAIERQMISDVPLGAFLSGGIDSSLIVASMARFSSEPVTTFSVSFESGSNEAPIARQVAEQYGTEHIEVEAGSIPSETLLDTLARLDEPLSDPAIVPTRLISAVARERVKVVLSGEGGDEVFGGYPRFLMGETRVHGSQPWWARRVKAWVDRAPFRIPGIGRVYQDLLSPKEVVEWERVRFGDGGFPGRELRRLLTMPPEMYRPEAYLDDWLQKMAHYGGGQEAYDADTLMRVDMLTKLSENHLFKSDRASMMESLELRVPFLDEGVLDAVLSLPVTSKIVGGRLKAILIELCKSRLPRDVWDRPKHGFNVPMGRFMAVEWKEAVEELLSWGEQSLPILDYGWLRAAQSENQRTHLVARGLWSPLMLLSWFRAHPGARL